MTDHIVKQGETFNKIAKSLGLSPNALKAANPQIQNFDQIFPGQKIHIPGPNAPMGDIMEFSAVVNEMGVVVRGSKNVGCAANGAGVYNVSFPEDVSDWLWQATLGAPDGTQQAAGSAVTQGGMGGAKTVVQVRTFEAAVATNRNFHLSVRRI